uniref:Reverse transcriptase domain-containing protein n=1 Tax=Amphimedon queenslandica TaxID=400682 RepID=A0A1X7VGI5_AMPQE
MFPPTLRVIFLTFSLFKFSDHFPISFSIRALLPKVHLSTTDKCFNFTKANYDAMFEFLLDWDFSECLDSSDVKVIWSQIELAICSAISKFVPLCSPTRRFSHLPKWFNSELRHKVNGDWTLVRRLRSHPTLHLSDNVSLSSVKLDYDVAKTKSQFITDLVSKSGQSGIYSHIRSLKKQDLLPPCVFLDSISASSNTDKAELFNMYFHSVYSSASTCHSPPDNEVSPNITDFMVSVGDTFKVLSELNPTKAMGIDGISHAVLKHCATPLCTPLSHLLCESLKSACFPSDWKVHNISPIFKSGDKTSVRNYRPISLLNSV